MTGKMEKGEEKGVGIIVVIIVIAFLLAIGVGLLVITGTGPKVAGNIRFQQEAFNAGEAGFDAAWKSIDTAFVDLTWTSFEEHYLREPVGIDQPLQANYFRRLTDEALLNIFDPDGNGSPDVANLLYFNQPYVLNNQGQLDHRYTYTVFLIDDEAGGGTPDPSDALMVCIGVVKSGNQILATSRIEAVLSIQLQGMNP